MLNLRLVVLPIALFFVIGLFGIVANASPAFASLSSYSSISSMVATAEDTPPRLSRIAFEPPQGITPSRQAVVNATVFAETGIDIGTVSSAGLAVADFNGDGIPDVVLAGYVDPASGANQLWFGQENNQFVPGPSLGNVRTTAVVAEDFNGDGHIDILAANWVAPSKLYLNDGTGNFTATSQDIGGAEQTTLMQAADLDNDGDLDLVEGIWSGAPMRVWKNDGTGTFSLFQTIPDMDVVFGIGLADVDGDGDIDAFLSRYIQAFSTPNRVFLNDGTGNLSDSGQLLGNAPSDDVVMADLDADGDIDAIVANRSGNPNQVWLNDGNGNFSAGAALGGGNTRGVDVADVNGDGHLDLFFANETGGANEVWLGDSTGNFVDSGQRLGTNSSRFVALEDFNGDGYPEAFVANEETSQMYLNLTQPSTALAIYVLAFDNYLYDPANLSPYFLPTIGALREASRTQPNATTLVLLDRDGPEDTVLYEIVGGNIRAIAGLPDMTGALNSSIREYNMADGETLAGAFRWMTANYTATTRVVTFVGHGTAVAPAVPLDQVLPGSVPVENPFGTIPLPSRVGADPTFTDVHPKLALFTPHDLRIAMNGLTDEGQNPVDVLDLTHCFAASIEEFYELADQAEVLIGSPNYDYFAPELLGDALGAVAFEEGAVSIAETIVASKEATLSTADLVDNSPDINHPRLVVAVRGDALQAIKTELDALATLLMAAFAQAPEQTAVGLLQAYQQTGSYYDTTYCDPQDWKLAAPDGLVDLRPFMNALGAEFGGEIAGQAAVVNTAVDNALLFTARASGLPWFGRGADTVWDLGDTNRSGLALYADLQGEAYEQTRVLSWQSRYYTAVTSLTDENDNPNPYLFAFATNGNHSWPDLFQTYWAHRIEAENLTIKTEFCLPELQTILQQGELEAASFLFPFGKMLRVGFPAYPTIVAKAPQNPVYTTVQFDVYNNAGELVFTDLSSNSYARSGEFMITVRRPWVPEKPGKYRLVVTIDPRNAVVEENEADNVLEEEFHVYKGQAETFDVSLAQLWVAGSEVILQLHDMTPLPDVVKVQLYGYERASIHPHEQVPVYITTFDLNPQKDSNTLSFTLPEGSKAGAYMLHVWALKGNSVGLMPKELWLNYVPTTEMAPGQTHYFKFVAEAGESRALAFDVQQGAARLLVWEPTMFWEAQEMRGSGIFDLTPTKAGEYVVGVKNDGDMPVVYGLHEVWGGQSRFNGQQTPNTAVGQRVFLPRPTFGEAMFTLNTAVGQTNMSIFMPLVVHP